MVKLTHTKSRIISRMELEPPIVTKAIEFLIRIVVVAVAQPNRIALGMAGHRQAQRSVARGTDGAPNPLELLPDGRSAPLDADAVPRIAVAASWE
jgi:hypothetical protein